MVRLLFWIILIAAVVWLWRRHTRPRGDRRAAPRPDEAPRMVRCAHCQVHLPQAQALQQDGKWYCSQAHLEQDHRSS